MPAKRKSSAAAPPPKNLKAKEKEVELREPVSESDIIISVSDREARIHRLNWTRLRQIAPHTAFHRVFSAQGEQVYQHQYVHAKPWFMQALCSYVNSERSDAMFGVAPEHEAATVKILNNLCWAPGPNEIVLTPALRVAFDAGPLSAPAIRECKIHELKTAAAKMVLALIEKGGTVPGMLTLSDRGRCYLTLSTAQCEDRARAVLISRLYYVLKQLGPAAMDPDSGFRHHIKARVVDALGISVTVDAAFFHIQTSKERERFSIAYEVEVRHYESASIMNPFD